jgi:hypothetical protein
MTRYLQAEEELRSQLLPVPYYFEQPNEPAALGAFESLEGKTRHMLLSAAIGLLGDWPVYFVKQMRLLRERGFWIRGDRGLPAWFNDAVQLGFLRTDCDSKQVRQLENDFSVLLDGRVGRLLPDTLTRGFSLSNQRKKECAAMKEAQTNNPLDESRSLDGRLANLTGSPSGIGSFVLSK